MFFKVLITVIATVNAVNIETKANLAEPFDNIVEVRLAEVQEPDPSGPEPHHGHHGHHGIDPDGFADHNHWTGW